MIAIAPAGRKPFSPEAADLTDVVSASRLNCFLSCRLKFYFRYVAKLTKSGSTALLVGKAVHAALQAWSNARWRGEPHDGDAIRPEFQAHWEAAQVTEGVKWDGSESEHREKAWGLVEMYLRDTPIPTGEKPEAVEVRVEADLARYGLPSILGIIDLVRPGGRIVDFKTSASTPQPKQVSLAHETQLTVYGLLYREATGEKESGFEVHHLVKTKEPKLVVTEIPGTTESQKARLFRLIESFVDGVERKDYVPSRGMHCMACEYVGECRAWTGGEA